MAGGSGGSGISRVSCQEGWYVGGRVCPHANSREPGSGYPFHLDKAKIPLGSRIMAVADIFSATTEDRPYRKGMEKERVVNILRKDADREKLSKEIVELLVMHYDEINECRNRSSKAASEKYQEALRNAER